VTNHARHAQAPPRPNVKPVPRIKSNTMVIAFNNAPINIMQIKKEHASFNVLSKCFPTKPPVNANPVSRDAKFAKVLQKKIVPSALRDIILSIKSNASNTVL
jgi:hypothetical protein